ncbi:hypothetical protein Pla52n_17140 [Stieleria varia]|uniref:Uncharacterized protein n=1 Tax=Stieleria varia TaxID=2528005 RepID=A0A5C6B266_9BACT|nr:hypothetical protein Pla52n_17140 [Stieleria varia]
MSAYPYVSLSRLTSPFSRVSLERLTYIFPLSHMAHDDEFNADL